MKRTISLSLLLIFLISSSAQALSWAYPFVVWNGKVYEVIHEQIVEDSEIGKMIGEVKTKPNDTGNYYGNASNYYPIGTKYYELKGISTTIAIAVKNENQLVKAVYVHKAPFHIMNVISSSYFISAAVIIALIILLIIWRNKKSKNKR